MSSKCIAIIRETKIPADKRSPLTPVQCRALTDRFKQLKIIVEKSEARSFTENEFKGLGITITNSTENCDILLGIKEIEPEFLIENKTYLFFSHTIKKQPHNREMLKEIIRKKITLIDYELLTDEKGNRLIGFGKWAGVVGAHYALLMIGIKTGAYKLKPAHKCHDLLELENQYKYINIPAVKIVLTGGGRVATGALEIMEKAGIQQVSKDEFINKKFSKPVFVQLHSEDLYKTKDGSDFNKAHFYANPQDFESAFEPYRKTAEVLINCMFWHPAAPRLFSVEDTLEEGFSLKTISDISCDVDGSVPLTTKTTSTADPFFGFLPTENKQVEAFTENVIDVMAIPNLPNELPRDASQDFGEVMCRKVLPLLIENPEHEVFERATIVKNGKLTENFKYLEDYVS